jgi:hypothetical protein
LTTQMLVYEAAVAITQARHGNWSVEAGNDYAFSSKVNSIPLLAVEFINTASEYPIVFGGTEETIMPAAILGLRADENLYVDEKGQWLGKYIPAFLRRYPFIFASRDEGATFTLCIDEQFPGLKQDGSSGEKLFGEDGKPSEYVNNVLKFLQQYQVEFDRTQALCNKLKTLNLLEPMQAQVSLNSGEKRLLTGFSVISRARLKTLPAETIAELLRADELELIYAHLNSMRNFAAMRERLESAAAEPAQAESGTQSKKAKKLN